MPFIELIALLIVSIGVVTVVEFLSESGQIHILGYILKIYFDTLFTCG